MLNVGDLPTSQYFCSLFLKRIDMKKCIFFLWALLCLTSCDSGVHIHPQFSDKEYDRMGQAVQGIYHGYYMVLYERPDGKLAKKDSIPASIKVTGWDKREVSFYECPIGLYANTLDGDNPIAHILALQPKIDFTFKYTFKRWEPGSEVICFRPYLPATISISGEYEGSAHHLEFDLGRTAYFVGFHPEDFDQSEVLRGREIRLDISLSSMNEGKALFEPFFNVIFYTENP